MNVFKWLWRERWLVIFTLQFVSIIVTTGIVLHPQGDDMPPLGIVSFLGAMMLTTLLWQLLITGRSWLHGLGTTALLVLMPMLTSTLLVWADGWWFSTRPLAGLLLIVSMLGLTLWAWKRRLYIDYDGNIAA